LRFTLECHRDEDGRLGGELSWEGGAEPVPFAGNLELLRLIEDHGPAQAEKDEPTVEHGDERNGSPSASEGRRIDSLRSRGASGAGTGQ
jgi:hypothetical protein